MKHIIANTTSINNILDYSLESERDDWLALLAPSSTASTLSGHIFIDLLILQLSTLEDANASETRTRLNHVINVHVSDKSLNIERIILKHLN